MATAPPRDRALTPPATGPVVEAGDHHGADGPAPRPPVLVRWFAFLALPGAMFLMPQLALNASRIDAVIIPLVLFGFVTMFRYGSPAVAGAARALPWLWLVLIGSLLGLATVGLTLWAVSSLAQTTYALLTFFCMWHLIHVYRLEATVYRSVRWAAIISTLILALPSYHHRAAGYFPNPNVAGHYAATVGGFLLFGGTRTRDRWLGAINLAVGLYTSSSFGAITMVLAMSAVWFTRTLRSHTAVLAVVLIGILLGTVFLLTRPVQEVPVEESKVEVSSGLSESRFEKSQTGRLRLWTRGLGQWADNPWGIGPSGASDRKFIELHDVREDSSIGQIHSDPLGMLVERGVIGLVGWIGMWVSFWSAAPKRGLARLMILGFLMQTVFRETIHYRHLWIVLALAMVIDHRNEARSRGSIVAAT